MQQPFGQAIPRSRWARALAGIALAGALLAAVAPAAEAHGDRHRTDWSRSDVSWWWDSGSDVGSSRLARTDRSISGSMQLNGLTPGDALTMWFIVFNRPEACSTSPCSAPADVFNPDTEADFHWGGGTIVRSDGRTHLRGRLPVGDITRSGKAETGLADPVALANPRGAEVLLAVHSHGPASADPDLRYAQLHSFTGGCDTFNGPNGFAAGPGDLPDADGECSTVQRSLHQP